MVWNHVESNVSGMFTVAEAPFLVVKLLEKEQSFWVYNSFSLILNTNKTKPWFSICSSHLGALIGFILHCIGYIFTMSR